MPAFNQLDPTKHTRAMDNLTFGQCVREVVARREEIRETCERHRGRVQRLGQLMLDTHEEIRIAETRNLIFTKNHRQPDMAPTQPSMSEDEDPEIEAEYERCSRQSAIINTQGFPDKLVKLLQDSEKAERYQKALWKPNEERSQVLQYLVRR
ncbi:hypothetical protein P152DRAFT_46499 [Eremomyces bilateralis CBS 781.70]|uniref:Uncharacterized protein n=1 Tax=Eremomyces bilateralis CBS 781.70 TaxID=1392243 RepID=A0A6G1G2F4_9PEZI|nr:uncharacterized protein P152DRAFT_46499 [Eremomyces bilateralis CBS 781.70]KAF1812106.1 hypothetical protein P152DRAFT_46499 [Eremomyces bilateralis CBS 781.70]